MVFNFGANTGYVVFVALCFVMYVVLPSQWSFLAEQFIGADVTKIRQRRSAEKRGAAAIPEKEKRGAVAIPEKEKCGAASS
jgi:hypothetical protein